MKILNRFSDRLNLVSENIQDKLDHLPKRDRLAVIFLTIFLVVTGIGSAVWFTHQAALNQQQRLIDLKETIYWMQTNAVQLSPQQDDLSTSAAEKVARIAQQQSLSIQSQEQPENQLKINTSHQNYVVLANFLTEVAKQGITIISVDMKKQDNGEIVLNGVLQ